ncbi:hypothetical protein EQW76_25050 [Rhizobium sp. rho-13.1]|uniref:XRE family transcriptional regulator n=1 Tax=Rhizobium rhododendri TaxID=2506430 RepID=A0ABY8ISZ5_9HYPH|nr:MULTISPECIES: hypothetical protein [Rhizobium]MBZ5763708.1 hypothetical protein [Rhizobium sp. VS19-DR96]MBZ5769647.1 hypothetical protein [Rhizobium sp. VS19-DR129.2]MBZ5777182.1 hypothetical protein [Rhizobium sp. VS19-DRK62.2]MBZ5788328.1 hypothetical protein [Rhizobium sp. VS19-DR121]MBZ5805781.1 hypothetical protein [Rhizobium sp. VS19-DR181]MBZ5821486.1 hypothetical protein [Rhizobium sp. VS19-DR183]MBZ5833862.1 hypothetical protein [Rhizobium sp. VS19-DR104.2]MBZ5845199.1 hypothet
MTPARFRECLRSIRWTSVDIVNALQCDLAWIEGLESGEIRIPEDVASWLDKLACFHAENQPPTTCRAGTVYPRMLMDVGRPNASQG